MKNKKIYFIISFIIFSFILIKLITLPPLVPGKKLVEIPENKSAYEVGKILKEEGIIKSIKWFLFWTNK